VKKERKKKERDRQRMTETGRKKHKKKKEITIVSIAALLKFSRAIYLHKSETSSPMTTTFTFSPLCSILNFPRDGNHQQPPPFSSFFTS